MGVRSCRWIDVGMFVLLCLSLWVSSAHAAECPPAPTIPASQLTPTQGAPRDRGFLWRISASGHTSWLYGTIHINKEDWALPGPETAAALRASKTLALEMDLDDPSIQQRFARLISRHAGNLPAALVPRVNAQLARVCLPENLLGKMHPSMLLSTIELIGLRAVGLYFEYGADQMLAEKARAERKPIVSLETPDVQADAILGPDATVDIDELTESLDALEGDRSEALTRTLLKTWAESDLPGLESYAQWCDCMTTPKEIAATRRLIDDRNPALADGIDALHRKGRSVFAAVGALHMIGPAGLPELLRQRGYRVERVAFMPGAAAIPPATRKSLPAQ
ncbi:TraB/GumN family protein [soil metagenome]